MRRGKPKNKKKYSSSVPVNNNNNIVQNREVYDSSGNQKNEKCEIFNCGGIGPSKEASNSGSSIPPICQEFLDVVSGMGLQIVPGQEVESQNSIKNEKPITQRNQNQWNKSSQVLSSKSNKAKLTGTQQNSNGLKLIQPMPDIKKECRLEEKRKDEEVFIGKSTSSESMRAACYKKPPGTPQYSSHQQLSGRSFLSSRSDVMKIKETKLAKEDKESNELKGDTTEQYNLKMEGNQVWNKNKKPIGKKNETFVKLNKKNPILNESMLLDSKSELKINSSNSVDAATHNVSWNIEKYKSDHEPVDVAAHGVSWNIEKYKSDHKPVDVAAHDVSWNIEKYKSEHDPSIRWQLKKKFLEKNKGKYPEEKLVSLAQIFCNTLFLGCTYSQETTQLISQLGSDLAAEYKEMKHLKEMKDLNYFANLPSAEPNVERSTQPSFYCTDIRYRKSTDKVVSKSFINQDSKSSIKQVYQNKCIKQVSQISRKELSQSSAKQKSQSLQKNISAKQKSPSSNNPVSHSSSKQDLVTHQKINYEKMVKSIADLEPAVVDAAYDVLNSSKPTFSLRSSEVHEGVLRAVGHVPYFTKVRLHHILMKHPSSFKIGSRPFKVDKNPQISLVWSEKKTSDDRDTDPSFYAGLSKLSFVKYDENSFEFEDDDDLDVLYSKVETVLTLDSEIKAPKAAHETIVTLTESDAEEAVKENVDIIDWVELVEERDHAQLNEFSENVLSVLNKLKSVQKNTKALAGDLKKLPINESEDKLDQCAGLILGLAVDDQTLTVSCADLCKSLETVKAPKEGRLGEFVNFRRLLLLKLQSEFEKAYSSANVATSGTKSYEKLDQEKVSFLGIVKFVGELYRVSMLTPVIVDECLSKLIVDDNDILLEGGCRLLAGVGLKFKTKTCIDDETGNGCGITKVDAYFKQLQDIYQSKKLDSSLSNLLKKIMFSKDSVQ